jgi:hypothetical protein
MTAGLPMLIKLLLPGIFFALASLRGRVGFVGRHFDGLLAMLAAAALVGHIEYRPFEPVHHPEFYHYYMGTKYFPELGYSGLYDASVVADSEDDPAAFDANMLVRSLQTYEMTTRGAIMERADAIKTPFTLERWTAFKRDIAFFRAAAPERWRTSQFQQDHGYNGSPLVTAMLGTLARQPFLPTAMFIAIAAWLDIALVLSAAGLVARLVGARQALLFVFVWAVNPFNDYGMIGGAYLRFPHLIALWLGIIAFQRRRFAWSGALYAVAVLLRIFPAFLVAGLLAHDALHPNRQVHLRRHARFYVSLAVAILAMVAVTSLQKSPERRNVWSAFTDKLALHSGKLSPNVLSLRYLFFYSDEHNEAALVRLWQEGRPRNWVVESQKTFAARRPLYLGVMAALLAMLALAARRGSPADGIFAGLIFVYAWYHLSHYDFSILALVPFLFPGSWRQISVLLVFWMMAAAWCLTPLAQAIVDLKFFVLSDLAAAYFVMALVLRSLEGGSEEHVRDASDDRYGEEQRRPGDGRPALEPQSHNEPA